MNFLKLFVAMLCAVMMFNAVPTAFSEESEKPDDRAARIQKCINCCTERKQACFNINPDRRLCTAAFDECVGNCLKEGKSKGEWSDCWTPSEDVSDE